MNDLNKHTHQDNHANGHHHGHNHDHGHHGHHHDHDHCHHHKEGVLNSFFKVMGWVSDHDHDHDHGHAGHDHTHTFETKKWILWVGTVLGTLALFHMIFGLFMDGPVIEFLGNDYVQLTMGTIAMFIMGISFIIGSVITLNNGEIAEDTLVAIAGTAAFTYSLGALITNQVTDLSLPYFFLEQIEVMWLIYVGRFIEDWLTNRVSREMASLNNLKPKTAIVIRDGNEIEVPASEIIVGDIVIVKTGQLVPVDGIVIEGFTTINESSLTGESLPIKKEKGSTVFGGTVSSNGVIKIEVTKLLDDSFISQIIKSVEDSMQAKPESQKMADKIAGWLVPSVLVISAITFILTGIFATLLGTPAYFTSGMTSGIAMPWVYSFYIFITILVVACPCSFAMTTPMSVLAGSSTSKREGAIFSSNTLFETIKKVDIICFDKTGTLTEGNFDVVDSTVPEQYLQEVVSIEKFSDHPLAKSIINHYPKIDSTNIKVEEVIGKGMKSSSLMIGSLKWVKEFNSSFEEEQSVIDKRKNGSAIIYVFKETEVVGYFELKDQIKQSTLTALSQIRKMGIEVAMITGDNKDTAINIASQLGIKEENVFSEVTPQDKSNIIKGLQDKGKVVTFVGDGINDSVALIQADIGIAMGEGSDAAIEAADIVLNKNDLSLVAYSIWLSRKTLFTIKRGFGIAICYNAILIPMAALGILGMSGAGPMLAALSMVFNDSIAMINAMTLKGQTKKRFDRKNKK